MAIEDGGAAPYTPKLTIPQFLRHYRERGMNPPIDGSKLARTGIAETLTPRTLQALLLLELIDEGGNPTDTLEGLRKASETDYQERMQEWLKYVYSDAFSFIDPASATEDSIRDAFRGYVPTGQQPRMVGAFIALCEEAGLREKSEKPERTTRTVVTSSRRVAARKPVRRAPQRDGKSQSIAHSSSGLPPALGGLLATLPSAEEGWTKDRRDAFIIAFQSVLDFCVPVRQSVEPLELEEEDDLEYDE